MTTTTTNTTVHFDIDGGFPTITGTAPATLTSDGRGLRFTTDYDHDMFRTVTVRVFPERMQRLIDAGWTNGAPVTVEATLSDFIDDYTARTLAVA